MCSMRWRRFCNSAFFRTARLVLLTNQIMLLAPIVYCRQRAVYRTHAAVTVAALLLCTVLCAATPFLLRIIAATYSRVGVRYDAVFVLIAMITQLSDVSVALLTMLSQIWLRRCLLAFHNLLQLTVTRIRQLHAHFLRWPALLLLWLQLSLTLYELLMQLVYLGNLARKIDVWHFVVNIASLYLQHCRAMLTLLMLCHIVLLAACYEQLAHSLLHVGDGGALEEIMQLQELLHALVMLFTRTFQLPLFLMVSGQFINVLANLYALLYYYVITRVWWLAFAFYCAKISVELYLLFYVVHLCVTQERRVRHLLLAADFNCGTKWSFRLIDADPLWPRSIEFRILGMFSLNNKFWLFLVSYSVNFIVIILEFGLKNTL